MGWNRHRLVILSMLGSSVFAACDSVDAEPPVEWMPIDQFAGRFEPEMEQMPTSPPLREGLRLVSYNVLEGVDVDEELAFFAGDGDLASADVIALQEVRRKDGETLCDAGVLARALSMSFVFVPTYHWDGAVVGIALLSRFPLRDVELMQLREQSEVDVLPAAARAALRARVETRQGAIQIVNVHLDVGLNIPERILQLRPAVLDAQAPVAVLGDFNTNDYVWAGEIIPILPLDAVADTSQAGALDSYMRRIGYDTPTSELGETWHGFPEDQRLDSVFTRGLVAGDRGVERELDVSDHWPVWVDVTISP